MAANESPTAKPIAANSTPSERAKQSGWSKGILVSAVATAFGLAVGWAGGQGGELLLGIPLMMVAAGIAFVVQDRAHV